MQACDTQPSILAGAAKEFIFSGRLDNLCMSFCSLKVCPLLLLLEENRSPWSIFTNLDCALVGFHSLHVLHISRDLCFKPNFKLLHLVDVSVQVC